MTVLALSRHGQTEWNRVGRFTGWSDESLTDVGRDDAKAAGVSLAAIAGAWDVVYTSRLRRAVHTADLALTELDGPPPTRIADWRLNERHVGDLEGTLHADVAAEHGWDAVLSLRWGWDDRPPLIDPDDPRQREHRLRYPEAGADLPRGESLMDVVQRVQPWLTAVRQQVADGRRVAVFSHGTTLRAIRVSIEGLSPEEVYQFRPKHGRLLAYRAEPGGRLVPFSPEAP